MRQAIETKYLGPTNTKGSRVKASIEGTQVTLPWNYELGADENHKKAATVLQYKLGWEGKLLGGGTKSGCVFVQQCRMDLKK